MHRRYTLHAGLGGTSCNGKHADIDDYVSNLYAHAPWAAVRWRDRLGFPQAPDQLAKAPVERQPTRDRFDYWGHTGAGARTWGAPGCRGGPE